jgi:hypothetical protein
MTMIPPRTIPIIHQLKPAVPRFELEDEERPLCSRRLHSSHRTLTRRFFAPHS